VQDWPLPSVFTADLQPDPTEYSHDQLALELGILSKKSTVAMTAEVRLTRALLTGETLPVSVFLALELQQMPAASQLQHDVLHCLMASNETAVDIISPTSASLLGGTDSLLVSSSSLSNPFQSFQHPAVAWRQSDLQKAAAAWVTLADLEQPSPGSALPGAHSGTADYQQGVRPTLQLNTSDCASTFFPAAITEGIVLWEPFGGLCAGLEMALRNGFTVRQYLYSDTDRVAQRVALHRVRSLQAMYPEQLPESALSSAFHTLPSDITQVTTKHLQNAVNQAPTSQWLVVAGWPCQDLSSAGPSTGLQGARSGLFYDLLRVLGSLQQLSAAQPPAYILENVAFQFHPHANISQDDFQQVCSRIGMPVLNDAAQFGSLAHRTRNYWTNLCAPGLLAAAFRHVQRPQGRTVDLILQSNRLPQPVTRLDVAPQYPCNIPGLPRAAMPTLMSRRGSYAHRPGQPGSILDSSGPGPAKYDELTLLSEKLRWDTCQAATA